MCGFHFPGLLRILASRVTSRLQRLFSERFPAFAYIKRQQLVHIRPDEFSDEIMIVSLFFYSSAEDRGETKKLFKKKVFQVSRDSTHFSKGIQFLMGQDKYGGIY